MKISKKEVILLRDMFEAFVSKDNEHNQGYEMATLRSVNDFIELQELEHEIEPKQRCYWCYRAFTPQGTTRRFMGKWYHDDTDNGCYGDMKDHYLDVTDGFERD